MGIQLYLPGGAHKCAINKAHCSTNSWLVL